MTVSSFNLSKQAPARLTSLTVDKFLKSQKNLSKPSPKLWPNDPQLRIPASGNIHQHPPPILQTFESCTSFNQFNQIHAQLLVSGLRKQLPVTSRVVRKLCNYLHCFTCPFGKICAEIKSLQEGGKVHTRVLKLGSQSDLFVKNSLIRLYSVCGQIGSAREVFDDGVVLDLVSWNSMIDGYVKNGQVGIARELFNEMSERDTFSWNIIIAGYVGVGKMEVARELFEKMPGRDAISWNSMIDGYERIENVSEARNLFDRMSERNIVSWNIILALYVRCKKYVNQALMLFDRIMETGEVRPNNASLVSVLTACATLGRLDKGLWVHSFIENNKIKCDVLLSTALLTMYAKCGAMDLARDVFDMEKRGQTPNAVTFTSCLSACKYSGKVLEGW
ncbi:Expansin-like B1 [Hibiscus syriacus]|uniref:Expansin-like B1 n=1 Tax=Hibiscus syriacus TaxID=106335 RepID=A0A6A2Y769_HIBSY|nr:Expansin-like B1 [Hibiscus syriacus]